MATRKPTLKNTYSTSKNIFQHIHTVLANHGARKITWIVGDTEPLNGENIGLEFQLIVQDRLLTFRMPVDIAATQKALQRFATTRPQYRAATIAKAYQVAWATVRDMIDVQMAMVDLGAALQEIFLPYLLDEYGNTLYHILERQQFMLPGPYIIQETE